MTEHHLNGRCTLWVLYHDERGHICLDTGDAIITWEPVDQADPTAADLAEMHLGVVEAEKILRLT